MPPVTEEFIRSVTEAIEVASGGDRAEAKKAAEAVLVRLNAPRQLCIVFFTLPDPIASIRVYAVSSVSAEVLASQRVSANETAVLRHAVYPVVQLEFEGMNAQDQVVATAPPILLKTFVEKQVMELLRPLPDYQIDAIPITYRAMIES